MSSETSTTAASATAIASAPTQSETILQSVERVGLAALTGGLTALVNGAPPEQAAAAVAGTAAAAAAHVVSAALPAVVAPIEGRLTALEASAGEFINLNPWAAAMMALVSRLFPHEAGAISALLPPPAPPAP
jgi:hypothetical protein